MKFKVILFCVLVFCTQIVVSYPYPEEEVRHRVHRPNDWPVSHNAPDQYHHTNFARPQNLNPSYRNQNRDLGRNFEDFGPNNHARPSIDERHHNFENLIHRAHGGQRNWRHRNQFASPFPSTPEPTVGDEIHLVHEPYRSAVASSFHQENAFPVVKHPYRHGERITNFPTVRNHQRRTEPYPDRASYPRRDPLQERPLRPRTDPYRQREPQRSRGAPRPVFPSIENLAPVNRINNYPTPILDNPVPYDTKSDALAESEFTHEPVHSLPQLPVEHGGHSAKDIESHLKQALALDRKRFVIVHPNGSLDYMDKWKPAITHDPDYQTANADGTISNEKHDYHKSYPVIPSPDVIMANPPVYTSEAPIPFKDVPKLNEKFHDKIITISPMEMLTDNVRDIPPAVTPGYDKIHPTQEDTHTITHNHHKINTTILEKLAEQYIETVLHHNPPTVTKGHDMPSDVHTGNPTVDPYKTLNHDSDRYHHEVKTFSLDEHDSDHDSNIHSTPLDSFRKFDHDNDNHGSVNSNDFSLDHNKDVTHDTDSITEAHPTDISKMHKQQNLYSTSTTPTPESFGAPADDTLKDAPMTENSPTKATVPSEFTADKMGDENKYPHKLSVPDGNDSPTKPIMVHTNDDSSWGTTNSPVAVDKVADTVLSSEKTLVTTNSPKDVDTFGNTVPTTEKSLTTTNPPIPKEIHTDAATKITHTEKPTATTNSTKLKDADTVVTTDFPIERPLATSNSPLPKDVEPVATTDSPAEKTTTTTSSTVPKEVDTSVTPAVPFEQTTTTTISPIHKDAETVTTTIPPTDRTQDAKDSKNITVTLNIPADNNGDTISVTIEVPPEDEEDVKNTGENFEDETLVLKIATKPINETTTVKPCVANNSQKSDDNVVLDLTMTDEKPVMWVRTTDENIFDKLGAGNDKVVYFFNVRPQALVERDRTKTVYPNGTIVIDMIEKIYETKEDKTPKIIKSTQVINPGDSPPDDKLF